MLFGKREKRSGVARRHGTFRPKPDWLEDRTLLAIDLGGVTPPTTTNANNPNPGIATFPYGVDFAGGSTGLGAGFSVTDVGDVNGDGYDDFVVGAPTVTSSFGLGGGGNSTAYLIFGSRSVGTTQITNWLTISANTTTGRANNRVGSLPLLGNTSTLNTNPITGVNLNFPFSGIKFVTSTNSQLGASVAASGVINGAPTFMMGAPAANQAFLVYGGTYLNNLNGATVNLTLGGNGLNFITFTNTNNSTASTGFSVAGIGDMIGAAGPDGFNDIAIGAPNQTVGGLVNAGAVFLVSGASLTVPSGNRTINLTTGSFTGTILTGVNSNDQAGYSIAVAGNTNGQTQNGRSRLDLLVGAPQIASGGTGIAYLVIGGSNLAQGTTISLSNTGTTTLPGAQFIGPSAGSETGFSVSSAGNFNGDTFSDFMIGSPGNSGNTGRVDLIYGQAAATSTITGTITLTSTPLTNIPEAIFVGTAAGTLAGYSLDVVGPMITGDVLDEILIGEPGFNNNSGSAFLLPGNTALNGGPFNLGSATTQPIAATQIVLTTPGGPSAPFFGASVSARPLFLGISQSFTADTDQIPDFIVGAPGYAVTQGNSFSGGAFVLQGAFVPLQTPVVPTITTQIGVGQPFGPFTVNATTPAALQVFVFSNKAANFAPLTQINVATVTVNGVAITGATIAATVPPDLNNDGIPDAVITIPNRSVIGLTNATTTFTISGFTNSTGTNANSRWTGTAAITVVGGGGGTSGGGAPQTLPPGTILPTTFVPPFGSGVEPTLAALSKFNYQAIPVRTALAPYLIALGFGDRIYNYEHPNDSQTRMLFESPKQNSGYKFATLARRVFSRDPLPGGTTARFTHTVPVVPVYRQTETFRG
jgi:hypothetical protein